MFYFWLKNMFNVFIFFRCLLREYCKDMDKKEVSLVSLFNLDRFSSYMIRKYISELFNLLGEKIL